MDELPRFRYYPDPIAAGVIEASKVPCSCCLKAREYIYALSIYGKNSEGLRICPWCIADGSAADKFDAAFNDACSLYIAKLPQLVIDEIAKRTPSFINWQTERWLVCCNDACAFLGNATPEDLEATDNEERHVIMEDMGRSADGFDELLNRFGNSCGSIAFYKFQCLHCGKLHYYCDFD